MPDLNAITYEYIGERGLGRVGPDFKDGRVCSITQQAATSCLISFWRELLPSRHTETSTP